ERCADPMHLELGSGEGYGDGETVVHVDVPSRAATGVGIDPNVERARRGRAGRSGESLPRQWLAEVSRYEHSLPALDEEVEEERSERKDDRCEVDPSPSV